METNKKDTLMRVGAISLSVIATTAIVAGATYAYSGDFDKFKKGGFQMEDRAAMEAALENGDYASWNELMGDKKIGDNITEENFSQFVEMHNLMKSGDFAGADEIRVSLGLPDKKMRGEGCDRQREKGEFQKHNWQNMEDAREAIEANDYSAWKEAVGNNPISEKITEENFFKLVESHNLMQSGDYEGAKEIREELGLKIGKRMGQRLK